MAPHSEVTDVELFTKFVEESRCGFRTKPIRIPGLSRSPFRTDSDHCSGLKAITVPGPSRSLIGDGRNRDRDASESPVEKSLAALDTKERVAWSSERRSRCPESECPCARPEKFYGCVSISSWGSDRSPAAPTSAKARSM